MANVTFTRGATANIAARSIIDGQLLFDETTGKLYVDKGTTRHLIGGGDVVDITRSGTTFTATRLDGTTFTFSQQDNNTTYSAASGGGLSLSSSKAFSITDSGVTADTYGPSADVTGSDGATINVPEFTVNAKGQITAAANHVYTSKDTNNDTKNTAGTTNKTGTKMFIVGATSQAANPQTYSDSKVYIGTDDCLYSNSTKVKTVQTAVSDPTASGTATAFIDTISQNANGDISVTKKNVAEMGAASASAAGTAGLVPAPASGDNTKFLRGDKTWATPTDNDTKNTAGTTNKTGTKMYIAAATSQAANPQTYSNSNVYIGTDNCLYSNGTKVLTAHQSLDGKKNTQTAVTDPTANGTSLEFIATFAQNTNGDATVTKKTVSDMGAASSSAAGTHGLVPKPAKGDQTKFLRGDATWVVPTDTKNTAGSTDNAGTKLFLIGAASQAANPQTYSNSSIYINSSNQFTADSKAIITLNSANDLDRTVIPSATINSYGYQINDKNSKRITLRTNQYKTSGAMAACLGAHTWNPTANNNQGEEVSTWLYVTALPDGTQRISLGGNLRYESGKIPVINRNTTGMWPMIIDSNNETRYGNKEMRDWIVSSGLQAPTHSGATNKNGAWIKYSNGLMHQWVQVDWTSLAMTTLHVTNVYTTSGNQTTTFGVPFNTIPYYSANVTCSSDRSMTVNISTLSATAATWRPYVISSAGVTGAVSACFLFYGGY